MNLRYIAFEESESIFTIKINNPPLNVLTDELLNEFNAVIDEICSKMTCRTLIIRGGGEKAFIAGADINQFPTLNADSGKKLVEKGKKIFDKVANAPFPVLCSINGLALGGGLELALACDIRIVEQHAKLGLPETGLGILPGYGGTQRLASLIGPGKAKELIFTGKTLTAEEAYACGLVEKVVASGQGLQEALKMAKQISGKAPIAISKAKSAINFSLEHSLEEGQELETNAFAHLCLTEDMQEGVKAFKEKRKPIFTGR